MPCDTAESLCKTAHTMNPSLKLLCAIACVFTVPVFAEEVAYPANEPLITLTIPEGWRSHQEDGVLSAAASQELDTLLVVRPLKATRKQGSEAVAEIKEALEKVYGDAIEYDKLEEGGTENLGFYILNATAKTQTPDEGVTTSYVNSIIVSFPDSDELLLVQFLSTAPGSEKHGEEIGQVVASIKKAG